MERKGFPESYDRTRCSPSSRHQGAASRASPRRSIRTSSTTSCRARRSPSTSPTSSSSKGSTSCSRANCRRTASRSRSSPTSSISPSISMPTRTRSRRWYVERFMRLKDTRFRDPHSYFHHYAELLRRGGQGASPRGCGSASTSSTCATTSCRRRPRADLILQQGRRPRGASKSRSGGFRPCRASTRSRATPATG